MVVFGWIINALMRSLCSVAMHVDVTSIASVVTKAQQCVLCILRYIRRCQQYETHLDPHATIFLSDFSQIWSFHVDFCTALLPFPFPFPNINFTKIRPAGAALTHSSKQT